MSQLNYMLGAGASIGGTTGLDDLRSLGDPVSLDDLTPFDNAPFDDLSAALLGKDVLAIDAGGLLGDGPSFGKTSIEGTPAAIGGTPALAGEAGGESAEERQARIERLRHAIRVDAYENELKFSIAVDRLLERNDLRPRRDAKR